MYGKADAAEFMQSFLELMHHCLNKSKKKQKVDDPCEPLCYIHKTFHINVKEVSSCGCNPDAQKIHDGDRNLFEHVINAYEII